MVKLVFASGNQHKLLEAQLILKDLVDIIPLHEVIAISDLPEPFETLESNAIHKASFVFDKISIPLISEDTGIFINALSGAPGVYSARFNSMKGSSLSNTLLVMELMHNKQDRAAFFRSVICLKSRKGIFLFNSVLKGSIAQSPKGENGFGYDPIFIPDGGGGKTFAEMDEEEKNKISHRRLSLQLLCNYLKINHLIIL